MNKSYKEICIPLLEKCRFLLYEVKPAISIEMEAYKKVNILYKEPRVRTLVKKVIKELKCGRHTSDIQKPEDIVNATIQSQSYNKSNDDIKTLMKKTNSDSKMNESKSETDDVNNEIKNASQTTTTTTTTIAATCTKYQQQQPNELELDEKLHNIEEKLEIHDTVDEKEKKFDNELTLTTILTKLTEKQMKHVCNENLDLMTTIVEFVIHSNCDVELLRKLMYHQVKRTRYRLDGLNLMKHLLNDTTLLKSVKYGIINGYLGLERKNTIEMVHCLDNIKLVTPYLKCEMLLSQVSITEWCIETLRNYILRDIPNKGMKLNNKGSNNAKVSLNLGTYALLRDIPRARMLLSILGILASNRYNSSELNPLINSGIISTVLALLKQTGCEQQQQNNERNNSTECYVLYADMIENNKPKTSCLSGPELASLMKLGTRVVRGADWKWGDQVRYIKMLKEIIFLFTIFFT